MCAMTCPWRHPVPRAPASRCCAHRRQQIVAVLDDEQIAVSPQPVAGVHHAARTGGAYVLASRPSNRMPPPGTGRGSDRSLGGPCPPRGAPARRALLDGRCLCARPRGGCRRARRRTPPSRSGRCGRPRRRGRRPRRDAPRRGRQNQHLAYAKPEVGPDVVPFRQIPIVEVVAPGNAVERIALPDHIRLRHGGGRAGSASAGQGAQTQATAIARVMRLALQP